jgi:hypothetical protein
MTSIANITVASKSVELEDGRGTHVFTVTNTYGETLTYGVKAVPDDRGQKVWFKIDGPKERQLALRQSDQISVNIEADPDVAAGKYTFHLLVYSTRNPGEDFTKSPTVAFIVKERDPVHKNNPPAKSWLPMVALATGIVAVVLSLITFFYLSQDVKSVRQELADSMGIRGENIRVYTAGDTSAMALLNSNRWADFPELSIKLDTVYWSPASLWSNKLAKGKHTITVQYRTPKGGQNHPAGEDWQNRALTAIVLGN